MKKKFLSLMMAAAMVATTSVSAFADKVITGDDVNSSKEAIEYETEVKITGDVEDQQGNTRPGTISVSVPTTAAFTVNKTGGFSGANLSVTNNGNQTVEVFANEFIDVNGDQGIKLIKESELSSNPRTAVSMKLVGNRSTAYLGSKTTSGIFSDVALSSEEANGLKISEISSGETNEIALKGEAGSNSNQVDSAVKDEFTLKLMIRKKTS